MIIYGTRASHLRTETLPGISCPSCNTPDALQGSVFGRYAHIYWIPLVPAGKLSVLHCTHCQQQWEGKAIPAEFKEPMRALQRETSAPWWQWSGLALLVLAVAGGLMFGAYDDHRDEAYLAAPQPGDVYTVHDDKDDDTYTLLKVVSAGGNSVTVLPNEYEIDNRHALDKLNSPDKYSKEPMTLNLLELKIMRNKDQIVDVDRLGQE